MKLTGRTLYIIILLLAITACNRSKQNGNILLPDHQTLMNEAWEDSVKYKYAIQLQSKIEDKITPDIETKPVQAGINEDAADDPAIFEMEGKIYIAGSNKKGGLHIYDIDGNELRFYDCGLINNVDVRDIINVKGDTVKVLGGSNRTDNSIALIILGINNSFSPDSNVFYIPTEMQEIYGFCMYNSRKTGQTYAFANCKSGLIQQWMISFEEDDQLTGLLIREISLGSQPEGMVASDLTGALYLGEERVGVYKCNAEADASNDCRFIEQSDSTNTNISYDIEGLAIYHKDNNDAYLVISSQGNFSYAVFDLRSNTYLTSFIIVDTADVDGAEETDGLDIFDGYISEKFPQGVLVVQDGFNYDREIKKSQNFKIIDWRKIQKLIDRL